MIQWKYLKNGNVLYKFKGNCTQENTRLYIELIDGNHDPVIATVRIKTFKPTTTDATDAVLWSDAYYHYQLSDTDQSRQLQDRSGNNNRGNYYALSTDGELIESEISVIENTFLAGNPVINVNGFLNFPMPNPFFHKKI